MRKRAIAIDRSKTTLYQSYGPTIHSVSMKLCTLELDRVSANYSLCSITQLLIQLATFLQVHGLRTGFQG